MENSTPRAQRLFYIRSVTSTVTDCEANSSMVSDMQTQPPDGSRPPLVVVNAIGDVDSETTSLTWPIPCADP
jgi:hypothetical protein